MIYAVLIITRWHIKIYMFFRKIFNLNHSRPGRCQANIHGDWRLETGGDEDGRRKFLRMGSAFQ